MAFKIHEKRGRQSYRVSVTTPAKGGRPVLRFYVPASMRAALGCHVEVAFGAGDDFGWVRMKSGNAGGGFKVNCGIDSPTTMIAIASVISRDCPTIKAATVKFEVKRDGPGVVLLILLPKNVIDYLDLDEDLDDDDEKESESK